ncbi:hypothetical protein E5163_07385 [Marinicauda algicola]|uniref:Uncharacterized protein n=1 Tax=Marinicauda algicola TaxID=2029849 RepID=A0A4S2H0X6_9PROT|nr:hypothetical protein [Marinicauda algicola]TGY88948.1 hypothetical protein E5163_07385 [Marinicauda algicola]
MLAAILSLLQGASAGLSCEVIYHAPERGEVRVSLDCPSPPEGYPAVQPIADALVRSVRLPELNTHPEQIYEESFEDAEVRFVFDEAAGAWRSEAVILYAPLSMSRESEIWGVSANCYVAGVIQPGGELGRTVAACELPEEASRSTRRAYERAIGETAERIRGIPGTRPSCVGVPYSHLAGADAPRAPGWEEVCERVASQAG